MLAELRSERQRWIDGGWPVLFEPAPVRDGSDDGEDGLQNDWWQDRQIAPIIPLGQPERMMTMPHQRDYAPLMTELSEEYARHSPTSAALNQRAKAVMVDGGSHNLRLIQPFPPRIASAAGAWLTDEDGHRILDFWQGHFANILGPQSQHHQQYPGRGDGQGLGLADRIHRPHPDRDG